MLAYPTEAEKGKYIAIFWAIFNLGGVVGSAVALGTNFNNTVHFSNRIPYSVTNIRMYRQELVSSDDSRYFLLLNLLCLKVANSTYVRVHFS